MIWHPQEDGPINEDYMGILIFAKHKGYIDNISSFLQQLRYAGYWLSDEILAVARKIAKE